MGPTGPADSSDRPPNGHNGHRHGHAHARPGGVLASLSRPGLLKLGTWLLIAAIVVTLVVVERNRLGFLLGIFVFVAALLVSVMLHELGHFLTAKKFQMRVTQFFVGFGNTLWSTFRGETEYGVKSLWIGGYVRISGMTSMEDIDVADEPRSFRAKPGWQRIIVLAAGSFMHFVLAMLLFFVLALAIGQANSNTNLVGGTTSCVPGSVKALDSSNPCGSGNLGKSPAELAGIRQGDRIVSVAGRPVGNWGQLHTVLATVPAGKTIPVVVRRAGHDIELHLKLAKIPGRAVPFMGVEATTVYQSSGFFSSWGYAGDQFADTITSSASAIGKLPAALNLHDLFSSKRSTTESGQVTSVVGVGQLTGDVVQASLPWQAKVTLVLYLIASLNILFGVFNLLPLLPLDGGHLAVVIFERLRAWFNRLRGRPDPGLVDIQRLAPVSLLLFALLAGVSVLFVAADIFNPVHLQV
jgi:membrane-associated protease RseP (regulator of RpoE activity)